MKPALAYTLVESRQRWRQEAGPPLSVDWARPVARPACGTPVSCSFHICPPRSLCVGPLGPSFRRRSFLLQGFHTYYLLPLSGMFFPFHLWVHLYSYISAGTSARQVKPPDRLSPRLPVPAGGDALCFYKYQWVTLFWDLTDGVPPPPPVRGPHWQGLCLFSRSLYVRSHCSFVE